MKKYFLLSLLIFVASIDGYSTNKSEAFKKFTYTYSKLDGTTKRRVMAKNFEAIDFSGQTRWICAVLTAKLEPQEKTKLFKTTGVYRGGISCENQQTKDSVVASTRCSKSTGEQSTNLQLSTYPQTHGISVLLTCDPNR